MQFLKTESKINQVNETVYRIGGKTTQSKYSNWLWNAGNWHYIPLGHSEDKNNCKKKLKLLSMIKSLMLVVDMVILSLLYM